MTIEGRTTFSGGSSSGVSAASVSRTGALAETISRSQVNVATLAAPTTGQLEMVAVELRAGMAVTNITFLSGSTALSVGSNQWFALYSGARALLGVTSDDTSTAWAINVEKTLTIAGGPITIPTTGTYYLGKLVVATTVPTMLGFTGSSIANALAPILTGTSTGSLTNPASAPNPAAAITATNRNLYAYAS